MPRGFSNMLIKVLATPHAANVPLTQDTPSLQRTLCLKTAN